MSPSRIVSAMLIVVLPAAAIARELPNVDAFASAPRTKRQTSSSLQAKAHPLVKPGTAIQYEERLGVPTFLWASEDASSIRASLARWSDVPEQAARNYLADFASFYRLSPEEAASSAALRSIHDTGRGAVIAKFRQVVSGIEVFRNEINVVMNRDRELIALTGYLTPNGASAASLTAPRFELTPQAAIARSFEDLTGSSLAPDTFNEGGKAISGYRWYTLGRSLQASTGAALGQPARVKKVWFDLGTSLEPGYYVELEALSPEGADADYYAYVISASDGRILFRKNLTEYDAYTYRVWADSSGQYIPFDGPAGNDPSPHPTGLPNGYQAPFIAPSDVTLQNVPFSRNDPWLPPAATETVGNNVDAYADLFSPDGLGPVAAPANPATGDFRAQATGPNAFTYTYDTSQPPTSASQRQAAITQLFFVNNFLHDWFYDAGFDEAAGNAQASNFGRGGLENDSLKAEAQDSSGRNNANMSTPADGARPRMQMYVFDPNTLRYVDVNAPANIAGRKQASTAAFGPQGFNLTGNVVYAQPANGCTALTNAGDVAGKIALIDRGTCTFTVKAENAQAAGAIGLLVANNTSGLLTMSGSGPITIPSMMITQADGTLIKAELAANTPVNVTLFRELGIDRDGTIDNMIIAHEWGHYISNRLVGNASGLGNIMGRGMGEGWADFHALLMTVKASDITHPANTNWTGAYAMSTYVTSGGGNQGYYFGIRRLPYSTDFSRNALTYKHIQNGVPLPPEVPTAFGQNGANNAQVHNTGEVWATMLWECYVSLLRDTSRLTFDQARDRMKQYLVAAYKMTPSNPTLVEARDALLAAAYANAPADYQLFGQAFARRGAGVGAIAPDRFSEDHVGVTESFVWGNDLKYIGAELKDDAGWCDKDGFLDNGERGTLRISIKNIGSGSLTQTTATVTSSHPGVKFPAGNVLTFPTSQPLGTVVGALAVELEAASPTQFLTFNVSITDPTLGQPRNITAPVTFRVHADNVLADSATDDVESPTLAWTTGRDTSLGATEPWHRVAGPEGAHLLGPDAADAADQYLISPPLNVAATGSFGFTFEHRHAFEASPTEYYDGGRIEISTDGGATWTDIGSSASPTYNGTLVDYAGNLNPLRGKTAYVGRSAGYPAFQVVTVDLGTAYQGQTVQIRFRVATDNGVGAPGWEVDDLAFTGITNTPFNRLVGDRGQCVNHRPTANAGPTREVDEKTVAVLEGSGSDPDGDAIVGYRWRQTGGPVVTLNRANNAVAYFTAPAVDVATDLTFTLEVTDATGNVSAPAATKVTVLHVNRAPVANAGPHQVVNEDTAVTLDGSASSDPDGDALNYTWMQTVGPTVTLNGDDTAKPTFTAPQVTGDTLLVFSLMVDDGKLASDTSSVAILVKNVNRSPTASAGSDQVVNERSAVTLQGSGTDPDGDTLSYTWVQIAGPVVTLSDPLSATPGFTAPEVTAPTVLTFKLTVSDGAASSTSQTNVTVQSVNRGPSANAGADQTVAERSLVTLHGTGTDPDGDPITITWQQTAGPTVTLSDPHAASPSFVAPEVGKPGAVLTFTLTVSDGTESSTSTTNVTVENQNRKPRANAGANQTVEERGTVTLSGTGSSDPDGDALQYTWTQVAGPKVNLQGDTTAAPTFTAPVIHADTKLTFQLVVGDGESGSDPSTVDVTVRNVNHAPSANAGLDQTVSAGSTVTLNGTGSSDPDTTPVTHEWRQVDGPGVTLSDTKAAQPTFTAPSAPAGTVLTFELKVTDDYGLTSTDNVTVTIAQARGGCGCTTADGQADASATLLPMMFLGTAFVLARRRRSA